MSTITTKKPKPVPGIPKQWQHFLSYILLGLLLPLLPLLIEYWRGRAVGSASMALAASMYALTTCLYSRNLLLFCCGIFTGFAFAIVYGIVSTQQSTSLPQCKMFAFWAIIVIFFSHVLEGYNKYVVDRKPLPNCMREDKDEEDENKGDKD